MITQRHTPINEQKLALACDILRQLCGELLKRGAYGTAAVEIVVQDGTIQSLRRRTERVDK